MKTCAFAYLAAVAALLTGCGPSTLAAGGDTTLTVNVPGGGSRSVITVSDLDTVRDVGSGGGAVYVATDNGLLVFAAEGEPEAHRLTTAQGMPSDDVTAVAVGADGHALVATRSGLASVSGTEVSPAVISAPPVGDVVQLLITEDTTLWACGSEGLAKHTPDGWVRFGEDTHCTRLVGTPESHVWIGTTTGLWYVEGDIVREHGLGQGIPEGYVRDVIPLAQGQCFALVQGPSYSQLAHYDGERWYGYTIRDFDRKVVGLGLRGTEIVAVTPGHLFGIKRADTGEGVPLTVLSRSERFGVRSYRARVTPATEVTPMDVPDGLDVRRGAQLLAEIPHGHPTYRAPGFVVRAMEPGPQDAYLVRRDGSTTFVADRNRGVAQLSVAGTRLLRGRDLIAEEDLQIASDHAGNTWIVSPAGALGKWMEEGLIRVETPDGVLPQAIASGPRGLYLLGQVGTSNTVKVYRRDGSAWTQVMERTLALGDAPLVGVPFIGVGDGEVVWAAVEIPHEGRTRTRGVAVFDPQNETIVYHHRASDPATDGESSLQMPDEISSIDMGEEGMAWFASFAGAIRVGNHQAVVFNEARGVRGEIVTDVAVGGMGRVWVAAAEGVGFYENQEFDFRIPSAVQSSRPRALAVDQDGHLWAAGPNGAYFFDGQTWTPITRGNGLPTDDLVDVEVDAQGRIWFLATDQLIIFSRTQ